MKLPHPIPYQGSKRNLADKILKYFPDSFDRLVEPFVGSAAITIASAYHNIANQFVINDINEPLINLWKAIINNPKTISKAYNDIWQGQLINQDQYYNEVRDMFNKTKEPEYLLFLLAKCVKNAVRYNSLGEFNQGADKRRLGRSPKLMASDILHVSKLLRGRIALMSSDYKEVLASSSPNDLVYMDPPYQGTGLNGGFKYSGNIDFDDFVLSMLDLNNRGIPFILSYDGRTGDKTHGQPLPKNLQLTKIEVDAGRSSQATLSGRNEITYEALYLSPALRYIISYSNMSTLKMKQSLILH